MEGIVHKQIVVNEGITLHVATCGDEGNPLVVLLHGFPELWYSWRHQIKPIADAGYYVAAPDLRGYGDSDVPKEQEAYDCVSLAGDVAGLIQALGRENAVVIGHDWGAGVTSYTAMLRPDVVRAAFFTSVPFLQPNATHPPIVDMLKSAMPPGKVHYWTWFLEKGDVERYFSTDMEKKFWNFVRHVTTAGQVPPQYQLIFDVAKDPSSGCMIETGLFEVDSPMADWMSKEDLQVYVKAIEKSGWTGMLNFYRNIPRNEKILAAAWHKYVLKIPVGVAVGAEDVCYQPHLCKAQFDAMPSTCTDIRVSKVIPNAGHWVQSEAPEETTSAILEFLRSVDGEK